MVLGFTFNLSAFISHFSNSFFILYTGSWFFSSSMDSSFLYLDTHSLCLAINQLLGFALSLGLFVSNYIILQGSSLLQPSYSSHLSNLYITYITVFVLLSCISLCTFIPNKTHSSIIGDSNQCPYIFSSSILLNNLIYYQPNHLRMLFTSSFVL